MSVLKLIRYSAVLVLVIAAVLTIQEPGAASESEAQLLRITPAGADVENVSQIILQFGSAVVPVGRMERKPEEVPIVFEPKVSCQWRWLNTTTLACELGSSAALQLATEYRIEASGTAAAGEARMLRAALLEYFAKYPQARTFITERPRVTSAWFQEWASPVRPQIYLAFNQSVSAESVASSVFFADEQGHKFEVSVLPAEKDKAELPEWEANYRIVPENDLPEESRVELRVSPGLKGQAGAQSGAEDRVVVELYTFAEFEFRGVRCCDTSLAARSGSCDFGDEVVITSKDDPRSCNPQDRIALLFSSPVLKDSAKDALRVRPSLKGGRKDFDPWLEVVSYSRLDEPHEKDELYELSLPYGLKANQRYNLRAKGGDLEDEFGRKLQAPIDMSFSTSHRLPRLVFERGPSVLEKEELTHLPLVVQNLDALHLAYDTLTSGGVRRDLSEILRVDNVADVSYRFPLKIRELLKGNSGVLKGVLGSSPPALMGQSPKYFITQITPFHVHVKLGHFSSLVWVTRLSDGSPVTGARVAIVKAMMRDLESSGPPLAEGISDQNGIAKLAGTQQFDPKAEVREWWTQEQERPVFKVIVSQGSDLAVVPLIYELRVEEKSAAEYLYVQRAAAYGHIRAWGATPQGIYKLGQPIDFKIFVRNQNDSALTKAPRSPYSLKVFDPTGKSVFEKEDLELSEFGTFAGQFTTSEQGAVGWYRVVLTARFAPRGKEDWWGQVAGGDKNFQSWEALRVLVSDFTPAAFKVSTDLEGNFFTDGSRVRVDTRARLHAGGPYTKAALRLTARVFPGSLRDVAPEAAGYEFGLGAQQPDASSVFLKEFTLDDQGDSRAEFTLAGATALYGRLEIESAVRDDRGKYIANQATAKYAGRDRYVGLKLDGWCHPVSQELSAKMLVVDEYGKVATGSDVTVEVKLMQVKASRVKGPGNTYLTNYETEWQTVHQCSLVSGEAPQECRFTPLQPGSYVVEARVNDSKQRPHVSQIYTWVYGPGVVLWHGEESYNLEIIPEKRTYRVGDVARFLVKNPFPGARALISLERFGVIKSWTEELKDGATIVDVKISPDLIPGFYLSVVVFSPRVEKPLADGEVDLGKPAMRQGYAKIEVRDEYKELAITAQPEREVYRPGDEVKVALEVKTRQGDTPRVELAVAVLDEAVFDLLSEGKDYFDPYKGFYRLDPLDLRNFNLLLQLIGRRKFEKKGANSGGDGGGLANFRSLFKFVSYWNPAVYPDAAGRASISFKAPDNLTGWRVLAMAVTDGDRMGLGQGSFKVNRETEIRPALPNRVVEGDLFEARFTIMNRTDAVRDLKVNLSAEGALEKPASVSQLLRAQPYERYPVNLPLRAGEAGNVLLRASAGDERDQDGLIQPLKVWPLSLRQIAATYGSFDSEKVSENYLVPEGIRPGSADVSVVLSPSVITSLDGAFRYLRDYPYVCWEQILTKGVMAAHYRDLKEYLPKEFHWEESESLPRTTLERASAYQAPNGGMTYFVAQNEYVDPYLSAYTALAFNWLKKSGYSVPQMVQDKLDAYLLELLRKNVAPDFYSAGMASSVRSIALAALVERGKVTREDIERHIDAIPQMSLFGKAHLLLALRAVADLAEQTASLTTRILAQANETSGKLTFQEAIDTLGFERILTTPLRDNCAVVSALLSDPAVNSQTAAFLRDNVYKVVRSITQTRKNRDHWENTQENVFCMAALVEYARKFESQNPNGTWRATLDEQEIGQARFTDRRNEPIILSRELSPRDLGKLMNLDIVRSGVGRLYYSARLAYSPLELSKDPLTAGLEVYREYSVKRDGVWALLQPPISLKRGELVRVDLYVMVPAARNFVVLNDPVPGAFEPVDRWLATSSRVDADETEESFAGGSYWFRHYDWWDFASSRWSFYHKELRHDSARFYSEYLPPGNYHLSYTAQVIATGRFTAMPVRAEEMYDPEVFGQGVSQAVEVQD